MRRTNMVKSFMAFSMTLILLSSGFAGKKIDEESTSLVRQYTTEKRFLTPLVDHIPDSLTIPSPREVLGYVIGTPKKLTYYKDIVRYMEILAENSGKAKLIPIGKTTLGRVMYIVVISSKDTIKNLEKYKAFTAALADPRKTSESDAKVIFEKAKPVYYVSCNLHSAEAGSAEMSMELAYRLVVSEDPYVKTILDNLIVLITPSLEPDGHDVFTDFYYRYRKDIDDESSEFPVEPYWGKYAFHDNNRDIGVNLPLTKNVITMMLEWHPQVHVDLHESFPYLYISPGSGPPYPTIDPIQVNEKFWMSFHEITELTKLGLKGVWTYGFPCSWFAGYLNVGHSNLHNIACRFWETFGNHGATTMERDIAGGNRLRSEINWLQKDWYRSWPPDDKVIWSMRNNVNFQQSGILVSLENVARNKKHVLSNFWKKGYNAVTKGNSEPPYAWVIPAEQERPVEMANIVNLLLRQGAEVHRLKEKVSVKEGSFPKGSYVVKLNQPLRTYAKAVLEVQEFPEMYPHPFDDTGWTLGYLHGVNTFRVDDKDILDAPLAQVKENLKVQGKMVGKMPKSAYLIPHRANNNLSTLRFALKEQEIYAAEEPFQVEGNKFSSGSFIIPVAKNKKKQYDLISSAVRKLGLKANAVDIEVKVEKHLLNVPRVAIYHTWAYTQDSGWARFAFDQYSIPYSLISKDRVKQGDLKKDFDIILIPRQGSGYEIIFGHHPKFGPIAYDKTEEFQYMGTVDQSKDITEGMEYEGLGHVKKFVEGGGILILIGPSSKLAMNYGLVRNIFGASVTDVSVPGSILMSEITNRKSPIVYGYEEKIPVLYNHRYGSLGGFGLLFDIPEEKKHCVVLQYVKDGQLLLSGAIKGEDEVKGKAAIVDVPVEKGHIIMFNFNPLHRFQNKVDFMLVFNILLNFDDLSPI